MQAESYKKQTRPMGRRSDERELYRAVSTTESLIDCRNTDGLLLSGLATSQGLLEKKANDKWNNII